MATKRKRQGKDWHGWAFYEPGELGMCHWACPQKPEGRPSPYGRWVRVKFVPVDPLPKSNYRRFTKQP
jgi:hypothetical protein